MKILVTPCCAAALIIFGSGAGFAQDTSAASKQSQETQQQSKTTNGNNQTAKVTTDTVHGRIESFEPGKSLKVTVPGKIVSTKSFDLNSKDYTYNVSPNLKQGEWVTVTEKTDNNGHKTLTVHASKRTHKTSGA